MQVTLVRFFIAFFIQMKALFFSLLCTYIYSTQSINIRIQSQKNLSPVFEQNIMKRDSDLKKFNNIKQIDVRILQFWEDDFVIQNNVICKSGFAFISSARASNIFDVCEIGISKLEKHDALSK